MIIDAPQPYSDIMDAIHERDSAWFEAHPRDRQYLRLFVEGEMWPLDLDPAPSGYCRAMLVTIIEPGVRERELVHIPISSLI
jgi:hypothetical protein